jgi:hypothetical protein
LSTCMQHSGIPTNRTSSKRNDQHLGRIVDECSSQASNQFSHQLEQGDPLSRPATE